VHEPTPDPRGEDAALAAIVRSSEDAVVAKTVDGTVIAWNHGAERLYGYPASEMLGHPIEILFAPETAEEEHRRHAEVAAGRGDSGYRCVRIRDDGTRIDVVMSMSPIRDERDEIVGVATISRPVSTLEAFFEESEARLRQLTENVDAVSTLWQPEPRGYIYVSPQFEQLTGYPVERMLLDDNFPLNTLMHPEDRPGALARLAELVGSGGRGALEHRIVRADGEVRWVRSTVTPLPDPAGGGLRIVGTSTDVTERVLATEALAAAEAEAQHANLAKNDFLSRMSHELRTPLHAILGFGQLLEMELQGTESLDSVQHVLSAGRHLLGLIDEVLDFARIESGQLAVAIEPVYVDEVVAEVRALVGPLAGVAGVTLDPVDARPCRVLADRGRLRQVLLNLLTNAIKYNRAGGRVWTTWDTRDDRCVISVGDDGAGIPEELHDRLFTPFDRLGAEATAVEGTGVGLSVTLGLMSLMDGSVSVDSEPGRGSVFTVDLPLEDTAAATPDAYPAPQPRLRAAPAMVTTDLLVLCVVDDDQSAQLLESIVALRPRWRFLRAAGGPLGVRLARRHRPDLVLLDLQVPDAEALDVLVSLHRAAATADVPVAVVSADASRGHVRRFLSAGAWRHLTKPAGVPAVLRLLDEVADTDVPGVAPAL
jgi:PAS domain S-box-containing protein